MNKRNLFTDNLEHYMECIFEVQNKLKKFRDVPNYVIHINNKDYSPETTKDIYEFTMQQLAEIYEAMKIDEDLKL